MEIENIPSLRKASKAELAQFFNVSLPAVEGWIRRGCPVAKEGSRGISWVFDLLEVAQWRFGASKQKDNIDPDNFPPKERKDWYEGTLKKRDAQLKDKQLMESSEVERTIATAFSIISQQLRAIPDNLERKHGIDPELVGTIEQLQDNYLSILAESLGAMKSGD